MVSGCVYVNANLSWLIWMKSLSIIFAERDAAVLVDITSMRTSGLRIVSGSLLVTRSQTRWKLILDFFGHHIFIFQLTYGIFPVFLGLFLDLLGHRWVGNTSVAWAVKLLLTLLQFLKAAKRVARIQNPSNNFCNWFSKTLLNRLTWKSVRI